MFEWFQILYVVKDILHNNVYKFLDTIFVNK